MPVKLFVVGWVVVAYFGMFKKNINCTRSTIHKFRGIFKLFLSPLEDLTHCRCRFFQLCGRCQGHKGLTVVEMLINLHEERATQMSSASWCTAVIVMQKSLTACMMILDTPLHNMNSIHTIHINVIYLCFVYANLIETQITNNAIA